MTVYAQIYAVVQQIPPGKVATYGQVAELANLVGKARLVGYALARVAGDDRDIPWQRVVNARGEISYSPFRQGNDYLQRALLEREGVQFDTADRVNLRVYRWRPGEPDGHTSL